LLSACLLMVGCCVADGSGGRAVQHEAHLEEGPGVHGGGPRAAVPSHLPQCALRLKQDHHGAPRRQQVYV